MNDYKKNTYYHLVKKIKQKGEYRPKRHGEYLILNLFEGYYLELDTWNNGICVYKDGKYKYSLGIDFGGFRCDLRMVNFWLGHIQ